MANRYWRGGAGTWNTTNTANWSATSGGAGGASVPTSADNVFFDQATTYTVTCTGALNCLNLTVSAGTVTFTSGSTPSFAIAGSFSITSTTTWTTGAAITFTSTSTGQTITTAGRTISGPVTFNGEGGGWALSSAFSGGNSFTVTAGAVSTNNFALTVTAINSSGTLTRSLSLGSSAVSLASAAAITFAGTGLTFSAGSSTITCANANATISSNGGVSFNTVILSSSSMSVANISGENTFATLTIQGRLAPGLSRVEFSNDQTIGSLNIGSGSSIPARTILKSGIVSVTRTLTVNSIGTVTDIDFQDIAIAGAVSPISGTRLGDCRGNSGINFPAPKTVYYGNTGTTAQNWGTTGVGSWSATVGGARTATQFPLAQDIAVIPDTLYPGSGGTITINAPYNIGTVDMSGRTTSTVTLATGTQSPTVYGDWINGTGTTLTGTGAIIFGGRAAQAITSNGRAFTQIISINSLGGSVTLQDALNSSSLSSAAIVLTAGTFNANGFNVTIGSGGFAAGSGTFEKTVDIGSGTWTLGNTTPWNAFTAVNLSVTGTGTISLVSPLACTFYGGNIQTYPKLNQGGTAPITINGSNGFSEISNTVIGSLSHITFTAGSTTTVGEFTVSGNATTRVQLRSTSTGTRFNISKASGEVNVAYLDIRDSNATGGAVWNAGSTSLNTGNNLGWIFTDIGALPAGNMFLMFM